MKHRFGHRDLRGQDAGSGDGDGGVHPLVPPEQGERQGIQGRKLSVRGLDQGQR